MNRRKVMLVDDDPVLVQILVSKLSAHHYDVVVSRDAIQSVPLARSEKPAVVLLDIGLPGGNGFVVLRRLKSLLPVAGIPVIVISSRAAETDRERMIQAGAIDYFEKPIDYAALIHRLSVLFGDLPADAPA